MTTKRTLSEADTLELYRIALDNAENTPEIAAVMAELGYDSGIIGEGKALLAETRQSYDLNWTEDNETNAAYAAFADLKAQLEEKYAMHRKKAKVIFLNDIAALESLALTGSIPKAYAKWLETVRLFYIEALKDSTIQSRLARLQITSEDLKAVFDLINELDEARSEYLKEKGESHQATQDKDAAFAKIDRWMSEFYAVARIALEDRPQLMEALGKVVKS